MNALPFWIEHGHWLGWLFVAAGGLLALFVVRAGYRRRLVRRIAGQRAALGELATRVEAESEVPVTLRGRLRSLPGGRLERPEDGAPVLAYGVIEGERGADPAPPWALRCLVVERAPDLWLELDDGTRVALEGRIALDIGSTEAARARARSRLPEATRRWIEGHDAVAALAADAPLAFRSVRDGDEVAVRGRLERRGGAEGESYRVAAASYALFGDDEIDVTYLGAPAVRGRPIAPELGAVLGGVATALAIIASLGGATADGRALEAAPTRTVDMPPGTGEVVAPFDAPPVSFLFGVLSPFHRDDAIEDLALRFERVAPASERSARGAFAAREIVSCERAIEERLRRGRYEEVLAAAGRCDEPGAIEHELIAALTLGRLDHAARLLERRPVALEPIARAELHVARGDWEAAAEALAAYVADERSNPESGGLDASRDERRGECLRRSLLRRAGQGLEPDPRALEDVFCRVAWADASPPEERRALLRDRQTWDDVQELAWLLAVEAPGRLPASTRSYRGTQSVFEEFLFRFGPTYSGLHASARRALARRGGSPTLLAALRGRAASFELLTGDPERAVRFAELSLGTEGVDDGDVLQAGVSVLALDALRRGDADAARGALSRIERGLPRQDMARWVALLGERDAAQTESPDWFPSPHPQLTRAALSGDGAHLARVLSLHSHHMLREAALLVPFVERDRDVLREHVRWSRRGIELPRLQPMRRLQQWSAEAWLARGLDDDARAARAERVLDRFRAMVLRRETSVPLQLVHGMY